MPAAGDEQGEYTQAVVTLLAHPIKLHAGVHAVLLDVLILVNYKRDLVYDLTFYIPFSLLFSFKTITGLSV